MLARISFAAKDLILPILSTQTPFMTGRLLSTSPTTTSQMIFSELKWLDMSIIKRKGKALVTDVQCIPLSEAVIMPSVAGFNLLGESSKYPESTSSSVKAKLVCFSFTEYGFNLNKSFREPFMEAFTDQKDIVAIELCFVEYGFLRMMRGVFASNLKKKIPESHHSLTQIIFGGVLDFAKQLNLPNKFAGYSFLLDSSNRVRWRGSGLASPEELKLMIQCTEELIVEARSREKDARTRGGRSSQ